MFNTICGCLFVCLLGFYVTFRFNDYQRLAMNFVCVFSTLSQPPFPILCQHVNKKVCLVRFVELAVSHLLYISSSLVYQYFYYYLFFLSFINVILIFFNFFLFNSVHLYIVTFTRTCTVHRLTCKRFQPLFVQTMIFFILILAWCKL